MGTKHVIAAGATTTCTTACVANAGRGAISPPVPPRIASHRWSLRTTNPGSLAAPSLDLSAVRHDADRRPGPLPEQRCAGSGPTTSDFGLWLRSQASSLHGPVLVRRPEVREEAATPVVVR
jgi:hypothetical protein